MDFIKRTTGRFTQLGYQVETATYITIFRYNRWLWFSLFFQYLLFYYLPTAISCKLWQVPNVLLQMYIWYTWAASRCHPAWRSKLQTDFPVHNVRVSSVGRTIFIHTWSLNAGCCRDLAVLIVNILRRNRPTFAPMYAGNTTVPKSTWSTSSSSNATTEDIEQFCCRIIRLF